MECLRYALLLEPPPQGLDQEVGQAISSCCRGRPNPEAMAGWASMPAERSAVRRAVTKRCLVRKPREEAALSKIEEWTRPSPSQHHVG